MAEAFAEPDLGPGVALADVADAPVLLSHRQVVPRHEDAALAAAPEFPDFLDGRAAERGVVARVALAREQLGAAAAAAQDNYPNRTIRLVVPFAAAGPTDIIARLVAAKMSESLGEQIAVDNRGGAGGNLGSDIVAKSPADGYTLLMGTVATHAINAALYGKMPYDPIRDFEPISLLVVVPGVLEINPAVPAQNLREFIALLKANPGKYSYGSSGNGTPLHLSGELFKTMAGVEMEHVPYRGSGPALTDLLAGNLDAVFTATAGGPAT